MGKTLVIYDQIEMSEIESVEWFFIVAYDTKIPRQNYIFTIQNPDGTKERVLYATIDQDRGNVSRYYFPALDETQELNRKQELQKIINRLEDKGYRVDRGKLALFMSRKISQLILGSK